jgi:CelD/BcsL family acetyltransferase involved in cellulose biosynthesis
LLTLELVPASDPRVEGWWRELSRTSVSYFLSWGWIACWLAMVPPAHAAQLAVVREHARPIAAAFLGRRREVRHRWLPSRQRHLNTTGSARFDELCIEHNAIVGELPGGLPALAELLPGDFDELVLPGVSRSQLVGERGWHVRVDRESIAPYVDLARVRAAKGDYASVLGPSTRSQLRRAQRNAGPVRVERATTPARAREIFDELVGLHTARWRERGAPGAFADPWFVAFHRRLIEERIESGEIELLRMTTATRTLGCLYNFVWHGRVAFYQSGLAEPADRHDKPGYLCHAAAIETAAAAGLEVYDFMAGDDRYKQNLATDEVTLVWARLQRPLARFALEDLLRAWRDRLR